MLKYRLISATIFIGILLSSIFIHDVITATVFTVFGTVFVAAAILEFFTMTTRIGYRGYPLLALPATAILIMTPLITYKESIPVLSERMLIPLLGLLLTASFICCFSEEDLPTGFMNALVTLGGFIYLGWSLSHLTKVYFFHYDSNVGPHLMFFLILVSKSSDIGGYVVGKLMSKREGGNHKITPRLSPGKSWEGFIGGIVFSIGMALILLAVDAHNYVANGKALITTTSAICIGAVFAVLAFFGDLAESVLKRASGVKDSGNIIPGMGGVMDVLDSLVFVSPIFYCYLLFVI